ncbi:MAG TPA: protein kinase [Vicinamibacterales bacterium]|nr:protein kinase [Vicinamibacterales bacterium]
MIEQLGPYRVLEKIGEGGMGEVYRALDTNLKRATAIKVLPQSVAADSDRLARFQREAEVLAAFNHPNIAGIYGLERSGTTLAIVMELVDGPTLADRLTGGPIPVDEALAIARQIAEGLEAAHEQGVVHRDLKPANVKVRTDGTVKILDFGLAKALEPAATVSPSTSMSPTITSPAMTQMGMVIGTAAYMSPEQARGRPVDKRADIWAFGCVLFELLTGKRAFDGEDVSLTLAEIIKSEPEWAALPALPPAVLVCLRQCLKKDPRSRLRDIGEMRLALSGALDLSAAGNAGSGASSTSARRVWPWVLPAAALSAAAAALLVLWFQRAPQGPLPQVVRFQIHAPTGSKIPPGTPAISPDGRTLAYPVTGPDKITQIHVRDLGSTESRPLQGTEGGVHPFWSPDGRSLAFVSNRVLKRIDIAGGGAREVVPQVTGPWHGSWGRFGDLLYIAGGVQRVSAEGGKANLVVVLDTKAGESQAGFPAFLADGKRFVVRIDREGASAIHLASLDSKDRKVLVPDVLSAPLVAQTPQGASYLLYLRNDALVAQELDERAGDIKGAPRVVIDRIGRVANPAIMPTFGVSPSGVIAYQIGGEFTTMVLSWFNRSGTLLSETPLDVTGQNPSLSPDGRLLAMDAAFGGDRDIMVAEVARGVTSRLTRGGGVARAPVWSPDSRRVAYARSGKIYVTNADGSSAESVLADVQGTPRSWSADGKYVLYDAPAQKMMLWLIAGGEPIAVGSRNGGSRTGRFSPDSRYLAYVSDESGRDEVYVQQTPPASGRVRVSVNGGTLPRWGGSSREIFFMGADRYLMSAELTPGDPLAANVPKKSFLLDAGAVFINLSYEVGRDGQRVLLPRILGDNAPDTPITVVLNWWAELVKRPD